MVNLSVKDPDNLRVMIAKTGSSMRSFSFNINISQGYLSSIINGGKKPSANIAGKIAAGLGVEVEDIFLVSMKDISIKEKEAD